MDVETIRRHEGTKIEIGGEVFKLEITNPLLSGSMALWRGNRHYIYATPNYEMLGLPIEVFANKNDELIDTDAWEGKLTNFKQYVFLVKTMTERILERNKQREKVWGK